MSIPLRMRSFLSLWLRGQHLELNIRQRWRVEEKVIATTDPLPSWLLAVKTVGRWASIAAHIFWYVEKFESLKMIQDY